MPSANVRLPLPLVRLPTLMPGQVGGVPGTDAETGLRTHVTGTVFYVDPNYSGAVANRDGTNPDAPLSTITGALANCTDWHGDVVMVMMNDNWQYGPFLQTGTGTYTAAILEDVVCTKHGVKIVGVCPSGGMGPVWRPATSGGIALTMHGLESSVEGFLFSGNTGAAGGTAILIEWNGTTQFGENCVVRNCCFSETIDTAIQLEFSWNNIICDNVFQECDVYGIWADVNGSACAYNQIHRNSFTDIATSAIALLGGSTNNMIGQNWFYNEAAADAALATNEGINTTGGDRNFVYDNWLSCAMTGGGNGDLDDFCTAAGSDSWVGNHCANGLQITNPA